VYSQITKCCFAIAYGVCVWICLIGMPLFSRLQGPTIFLSILVLSVLWCLYVCWTFWAAWVSMRGVDLHASWFNYFGRGSRRWWSFSITSAPFEESAWVENKDYYEINDESQQYCDQNVPPWEGVNTVHLQFIVVNSCADLCSWFSHQTNVLSIWG